MEVCDILKSSNHLFRQSHQLSCCFHALGVSQLSVCCSVKDNLVWSVDDKYISFEAILELEMPDDLRYFFIFNLDLFSQNKAHK